MDPNNPTPQIDLSGIEIGGLNGDDPVGGDEGSQFSLANPFLETVDETDREIVAKYITPWDQQVGGKFKELHDMYEPYKQLGEPVERLQMAINLLNLADQDPMAFYNQIGSALKELGMLEEMDPNENEGGNGNPLPEYEGLPDSFVNEWQGVKDTLNSVNEFIQQQKQSQESQTQQQQLDNLMRELHTEYGDFDEDAVLGRMLKGMSEKDAIADYKKSMEKLFGTPRHKNPTPPTIGGSGQQGREQVDASKLKDPKSRREYIASRLANISD